MEEIFDSTLSYTPVYDDVITRSFKNEFPRLKDEYYLDHAGATLYSNAQIKNTADDLCHSLYANPHSMGTAGGVTQDVIERTRYRILSHFHTSPEEYSVIFTSGATAALKIVAETFLFKQQDGSTAYQPGCFVYTQDNHTSVLGMRDVVAKKGAEITCLSHNQAFQSLNHPPTSNNPNAECRSNSLFVYSAQCNFSGLKFPLSWISNVHNGALSNLTDKTSTKWYVLLDAAGFVSTNDLDLSVHKPDFVCVSFYKMFGYPSGIGALLVRNSSADVLDKSYYGGGTVDVVLSSEMFHAKRQVLHQRFEDGTVPFLSIISLRYGFDILSNITMKNISNHVFTLAKILHHTLLTLHHSNGKPVVKLYSDTDYEDSALQGGIVTFNLMRCNGEHVGYMEVLNMAAIFKIHLRTGCFCNPGACQRHLHLSNKEILQNYDAGYVCGGAADLLHGKPTGAVRVSFGYMSSIKDVEALLLMITRCFVDGTPIRKLPHWWVEHKRQLHEKYNYVNRTKILIQPLINKQKAANSTVQIIKEKLTSVFNEMKLFASAVENEKYKKKCTLERLFIYPIKSCAAYEVTEPWVLNSKGLQYDREWMVMTSSGACLTQKQHVNLCLLKPIICREKKVMELTYPGMPSIEIPLEHTSGDLTEAALCQSRVCGHKVEGIDCGSAVSEWLSLALGRPNLRLIKQRSNVEQIKVQNKPELSFSSQAQYLLINKASVSWITNKVPSTEIEKDTMLYRFRGNMILTGCEAFEELRWKYVRIGKHEFMVNGPCTRCQMICIDQTTGIKTVEPLRTLAEKFHGKLKFGAYLTKLSKEEGVIKVGDVIYFT